MLTKQRSVLTRRSSEIEISETNSVEFAREVEDEEDAWDGIGVNLWEYDWRDMGSPTHITVTIEPGDLLNQENQ